MRLKCIFLNVILFVIITVPVLADVKLPAVFSDNMVFQQNSEANLWGWADPGEVVEIKASWLKEFGKTVKAGNDGKWKLSIRTPEAGGPHTVPRQQILPRPATDGFPFPPGGTAAG